MSPFRKIFASLLIVGIVTAGGVACGTDDSSKSSDSAASTDAWCKKFEELVELDEETGLTDEEVAEGIEALAKDAPGEIRDDMNYFASLLSDAASLDSAELDDPDALEEQLEAFEEKYDDDEIDAVGERIDAFMEDECGIEFDAD